MIVSIPRGLAAIWLVALLGGQPAFADDPDVRPPVPADPVPREPHDPVPARVPEPVPPKVKQVVVRSDVLFHRHGISPDLTLATGIRAYRGEGDQSRLWFARARAGFVLYNEPAFLGVGITGQFSVLDSAALGLEAQYVDLWRGVWAQAGVSFVDSAGGTMLQGAVGFTLFGLEYVRRLSGDRKQDHALVVSVHIPLGVIRVAMKKQMREVVIPMTTSQ